jgi:hypothetical protein
MLEKRCKEFCNIGSTSPIQGCDLWKINGLMFEVGTTFRQPAARAAALAARCPDGGSKDRLSVDFCAQVTRIVVAGCPTLQDINRLAIRRNSNE